MALSTSNMGNTKVNYVVCEPCQHRILWYEIFVDDLINSNFEVISPSGVKCTTSPLYAHLELFSKVT